MNAMTKPLRVLVVDDSAFARQTISAILREIEGVEVVGKATDGADAIPKILKLAPDIITLDIEMPNMDGYGLLRWLMANRPTPTVVVSSVSGAADVFRALELGAVDFVRKPQRSASPELRSIRNELQRIVDDLPRLRLGIRTTRVETGRERTGPPPPPELERTDRPTRARTSKLLRTTDRLPSLVVVGASTGGPAAIEALLRALPPAFPVPILIVQHMPSGFTHLFADRLDRLSSVRVVETSTGIALEPGTAYVCAGGQHTILDSTGTLATVPATEDDRYVPSVDRTMMAAASIYGAGLLGVLLTGMGDDGKRGMLAIDRAGGLTVAESEETSLVFGMPERAIAAGAIDLVLPLDGIRNLLLGLASRSKG